MANRSTFPVSIDTFIENSEINASDIPLLTRYQELRLKTNKTPSDHDELADLIIRLLGKLMTAEDYNHMKDAITNLQKFFRDNVDGFLQTKQEEFQALLDRFTILGEYNSTIQYKKWNTITYQGESYIALADSFNKTPDRFANTPFWAKIAAQGIQGIQGLPGVGLTNTGAWSASKQYYVDQVVQYNGQLFASVQNNIGIAPNPQKDTEYWTIAVGRGPATFVTPFEKTVTVTNKTTNVPINIPEFNVIQDLLTVIKNTTTLVKGTNYKINNNGTSIDSLEGQWDGTVNPITFHFTILKNFVADVTYADGTMIQNNTISKDKLTTALKAEINEIDIHKNATMPHQFSNSGKTYKYGFKVNANADGLVFVYEEVL